MAAAFDIDQSICEEEVPGLCTTCVLMWERQLQSRLPSRFTQDPSLLLCCVVNTEQWGRGCVPGFSLAGDAMVGLAVSSERVALVSDGHGFTHPHGIAGTGVTGAGAGQYFFACGTPAPVTRVCGFGRRRF